MGMNISLLVKISEKQQKVFINTAWDFVHCSFSACSVDVVSGKRG